MTPPPTRCLRLEALVKQMALETPSNISEINQQEKKTDQCFKSIDLDKKRKLLLEEKAQLSRTKLLLQQEAEKGNLLITSLLAEAQSKLPPEEFAKFREKLAEFNEV